MSNLCVADHGDEDAEALPALRLCRAHRRRFERDVRALGRLHGDLAAALGHDSSPRYGNRITGTSAAPLPINPAVADLRDQIRHDLVFWVLFVADQRSITGLPDDRVSEIAGWLLGHVEWLAGHPAGAVECPPVMAALAGRARGILAPDGAKRIRIGVCRDSVEDGPCGGTIWATVRADDDPKPSEVYCDGPCGLKKGAVEWRRWGREYLKEGRMAG